jgi:UDP-glucose 4-epimerase
MQKYKVKNIIFSSSATVYDSNNSLPLTEESVL